MPKTTAVPELVTPEQADLLLSRFQSDIQQSKSDNQSIIDEVLASRRLMRYHPDDAPGEHEADISGETQAKTDPEEDDWRSTMTVPYTKSVKLQLLSYLMPLLVDPDPAFSFSPNNTKSKLYTHAMDEYQQAQLTRLIPYHEKMYRAFNATLTDMTGIVKITYRQEWAWLMQWQDANPADPEGKPTPTEVKAMIYDAPDIDIIPFEQVGTFPRANWDIQKSPGFFCDQAYTGEEIVQRGMVDADNGGFWAEGVESMRTIPPDTIDNDRGTDDPHVSEVGSASRGVSPSPSENAFLSGRYILTEIYWKGPVDLDEAVQGTTELPRHVFMVVHIPSSTVLYAGRLPWWHGQRPFVDLRVLPDVDGLAGDSIRTCGAGQIQEAKTDLIRAALDSLLLGIDPPNYTARSLGADMDAYRTGYRPHGEIPMSEAFWQQGGDHIKSLFNGKLNPEEVIAMCAYLDKLGEECSGSTSAMKESPDAGQMTATQAQQIMETSQSSLLLLARNLSVGLRKVGEMLFLLNYQFMGNDGPQALWQDVNGEVTLPAPAVAPGGVAGGIPNALGAAPAMPAGAASPPVGIGDSAAPALSPSQQQPVPPSPPQPITMYDAFTKGSYTVVCNGVRDTANKAIRQKRVMEAIQLVSTPRPPWIEPSRWWNILYAALTADGIPDPAQFISEHDEYVAHENELMQQQQQHDEKIFQQAQQLEQIKHQPKQGEAETIDPMRIFKEALAEYVAKEMAPAVAAQEIAMPPDHLQVMKDMQEIIGTDLQHQQQVQALNAPAQPATGGNTGGK
jgi:hypothetical protein